MKRLLLASIIGLVPVLGTSALAATVCYQPKLVSGNLNCDSETGNSADFETKCSGGGQTVVLVQVPCPVPVTPSVPPCNHHTGCGMGPTG